MHNLSVHSGIGHNHGWCRIRICLCGKRNHIQAVFGLMVDLQTDIIAVQRVLYKQTWSFTCKGGRSYGYLAQCSSFPDQWLLIMSTQLIGLSTGGIARRLLVAPPSMSERDHLIGRDEILMEFPVWPNTLVICALFNTLHSQRYLGADDTGPSRERFFAYAFLCAALWCMCSRRLLVVTSP
jgi:hypothetical protein